MIVELHLGFSKKASNVLFWDGKTGTVCWDLCTHGPKRCTQI